MKNNYNKGRFRSLEWGKIPPYLKTKGNRKFRRTVQTEIEEQQEETVAHKPYRIKKRNPKTIQVKITEIHFNHKFSNIRKYKTERDLLNSINRPNVVAAFIKNGIHYDEIRLPRKTES